MTYTTILDLVRAKKNTMITTPETKPENPSKRVTATSANIPPSKRTKSDHDGSTSSPAQSSPFLEHQCCRRRFCDIM